MERFGRRKDEIITHLVSILANSDSLRTRYVISLNGCIVPTNRFLTRAIDRLIHRGDKIRGGRNDGLRKLWIVGFIPLGWFNSIASND